MTLITHLWSKDYHIVAADGRIQGTVDGKVVTVCEDYPKIIPYLNGFIALTCNHLGFADNEELITHIAKLNPSNTIEDVEALANCIFNSIRKKDPEIDSHIYVVKFDESTNQSFIIDTLSRVEAVPNYHLSFNGLFTHTNLVELLAEKHLEFFNTPLPDLNFSLNINDNNVKPFILSFYEHISKLNSGINTHVTLGILQIDKIQWFRL